MNSPRWVSPRKLSFCRCDFWRIWSVVMWYPPTPCCRCLRVFWQWRGKMTCLRRGGIGNFSKISRVMLKAINRLSLPGTLTRSSLPCRGSAPSWMTRCRISWIKCWRWSRRTSRRSETRLITPFSEFGRRTSRILKKRWVCVLTDRAYESVVSKLIWLVASLWIFIAPLKARDHQ